MTSFGGKWRHVAMAGGATCALLGFGAAGYTALRARDLVPAETLVSRGLLPETGLIVLADFEDNVGDPSLVSALEQAWRGPILDRLGRLPEERGETEDAVRRYRQLAALWEEADPELQPRVAAVNARLLALAPDASRAEDTATDAARGRGDVAAPLLDEGRVGYGEAWR